MTRPLLYQYQQSPWSERARWALEHHLIDYRRHEYTPYFEEPILRLRLRRLRGRVSLPVLFADGKVYDDSFSIAREAERRGGGPKLFPVGADEDIAAWNGRSEALLSATRALEIPRVLADREAVRSYLPSAIPGPLKRLAAPLAAASLRHVVRKYQLAATSTDEAWARIEGELAALTRALAGERRYLLLDRFTYADLTMATAFQLIAPVADKYIRMNEYKRRYSTDLGFAGRHAALLAWRDGIYERHRPTRPRP